MLNFSEHRAMGKKIKAAYAHLLEASTTIASHYPGDSPHTEIAKNALSAVRRLKSIMDDAVGNEHSEKSDAELNKCYFGESQTRRS